MREEYLESRDDSASSPLFSQLLISIGLLTCIDMVTNELFFVGKSMLSAINFKVFEKCGLKIIYSKSNYQIFDKECYIRVCVCLI